MSTSERREKNTKKKKQLNNYAFIDGQNLEAGLREVGLLIDYKSLFAYLKRKYKVDKIFYCAKFSRNKNRQLFFEKQKQFVKIITPSRESTSNMLSYDRFYKKKRFLTYISQDLQKLTQKISPPKGSGGIDET